MQSFGMPQNTAINQQMVKNKVLRNTYLLLALSMIPTVIGAFIGVQTAFILKMPFWMHMLVFFGVAYGLMFAITKNKDNEKGVMLLLLFTFFMGLMLSNILLAALRFSNGPLLIATAGVGTSVIFFSLAGIATVTKKDFSFMQNFLFVGVIIAFVAAIANIFLAIPVLSLAISTVFLLVFSGYILYDVSRIVNGGETNYISATLALYLDIYNVFVSLLHLLMMLTGRRD